MHSIESLLSNAVDQPLISYHGLTETQVTFARRVESMIARLRKITPLKTADFVIIDEKNPVDFFSLLLALWENGNRVILPTRDFYCDPEAISYYHFAVSCAGDEPQVTANPSFDPVDVCDQGDVVAFSSGSTGTPKGILHDHSSFLANASAVSARMLEQCVSSLTFLKPYLVSALSHFFVHFLTGSHLRFENYDKIHQCVGRFTGGCETGIVGSPMHLTSALQFMPQDANPRIFFSSGDFLSAASIKRILNRFPQSAVYNVYGLAELAGRFFINRIDADTPDHLLETIGSPIVGAEHRLENGQIYAKAEFLFKGYIIGGGFQPAARWHPSQDLAQQGEPGMFLIGRSNDEVKILGNKVSIKHIENRIKAVLDRDVVVTLASEHPVFGNILSLVLGNDDGLRRTELIRQLRNELKPYEIPHQYFIMDDIPFTQSMKIDRAAIARRLNTLRAIP
jgi:acyl-CoA synthetase (AMP-forming)/AMP-acid ligase II